MHVHILGICGTFMAGVAKIAREKGFKVTGQDEHVYPPMSNLLEDMGIDVTLGYEVEGLPAADVIVVGNAMKRGMPIVEHILTERLNYISGPRWLYREVLKNKRVIAIAGTHGKTTTSAMTTWILESAGLNPSFLVGGVLPNFHCSSRLTDSEWFVIEADEYDTAFFDKRSKFVHYHPEIVSINNLEFDHADIFDDINHIIFQFHCLLRMLPENGLLITPNGVELIEKTVEKGFWSERSQFNDTRAWHATKIKNDGSHFEIYFAEAKKLEINWNLIGEHNIENALVALIVAYKLGIGEDAIVSACESFKPVKRRLEMIARDESITLYEDFAHHPTAIKLTLEGLRHKAEDSKIIAIIDFGSHTMRSGYHKPKLLDALNCADEVIFFKRPFDLVLDNNMYDEMSVEGVVNRVLKLKEEGAHIVLMSNRSTAELTKTMVERLELSMTV